jgi:uncharacterized protein with PIN domain
MRCPACDNELPALALKILQKNPRDELGRRHAIITCPRCDAQIHLQTTRSGVAEEPQD